MGGELTVFHAVATGTVIARISMARMSWRAE